MAHGGVSFYNSLSPSFHGGGEISGSRVADALGKSGFDVEYVSGVEADRVNRAPVEVLTTGRFFRYRTARFVDYSTAPFSRLHHPLPVVTEMDSSRAHLILCYRLPPPDFLREVRRTRAKVALLLHGVALEPYSPFASVARCYTTYQNVYLYRIGRSLCSSGVTLQAMHPLFRQLLLRVGVPENRIHLIRSGVPIKEISRANSGSTFVILFIGRLESTTKGADLLLKISKALQRSLPPAATLQIVGSGSWTRKFESLGNSESFSYRGFVDDDEKRRLVQSSSLLILTSKIDVMPLVPMEAMVAGLPVLTTPCYGPASLVALDPSLGEVVNPQPAAFCRRVLDYYADWARDRDSYLARMSRRSELARKLFDDSEMIRGYERLVTSMLGG